MFFRSIASALPPRSWTQPECWNALRDTEAVRTLLPRSRQLLEKVLLGNAGIHTRHFATEQIHTLARKGPQQQCEDFEREAVQLGAQALQKALQRADLAEVDALFVCTCTGNLCPGLSSHVAEQLHMPPTTYLADLTGAGCGATLPTLHAACAYLAAHPSHRAAVLAVEICSAAFYLNDDPGVLISLCLFGDGAAAMILDGEQVRADDKHFGHFHTLHLPQHREKIRLVNRNGHLCNQLHRDVPELAADAVFSLSQKKPLEERSLISHGGGRDVLEAIQKRLPGHPLLEAKNVLSHCGNMSSPSVLFALEQALQTDSSRRFWITSFGAGFAAHSCTLEP